MIVTPGDEQPVGICEKKVNSLVVALYGDVNSRVLEHSSSFVTAKMSIKGGIRSVEGQFGRSGND